MKKSFSHIHMPTFICGRGSISFVRTLNKERVAVVGYSDVVKEIADRFVRRDSNGGALYRDD